VSFEALAIERRVGGVRFARQREAAYTEKKGAVYERAMVSISQGLMIGVSVDKLWGMRGRIRSPRSLVLRRRKAP
jgi:hypothetical protein